MLGFQKIGWVAERLGMGEGDLRLVAEFAHDDIKEYTVWHPDPRKKPRDVVAVHGPLRKCQIRLLKRIFDRQFSPSAYSHGGVKGRHPLSNAQPHFSNRFAMTMDVANFYPSLSNWRVNRLFLHAERCSPPVARILTSICTYQHHLALGLVTSPKLADQIMLPLDRRIARMCAQARLCYTRYVDDITISGRFNLERSGIRDQVTEILLASGLSTNHKTQFGRIDDGFEITGVRLNRGHADVGRGYMKKLVRLLDDHHALAAGRAFSGPLMTSSQLEGKVYAAVWINPGRRASLLARLRSIRWDLVFHRAAELGLVRLVERLAPRGAPRPDHAEPLPLRDGQLAYERWRASNVHHASVVPFDV